MIPTLIAIFFIGYLAIALEHPIKIDKTATALLLGMILWIIYALCAEKIVPVADAIHFQEFLDGNPNLAGASLHQQALAYILDVKIVEALGDITQTLLFLIGAMTIVELVDVHSGFSVITDHIKTRKKYVLLWVLCITTFFFSAVLDNMTTTIVMILLLRKLLTNRHEKWLYASMIVIAANTGGAWSPIGDVTTIMLWVKGNVTAPALVSYVLLPSVVAMVVPLLWIGISLKGTLSAPPPVHVEGPDVSHSERLTIFCLGVGGLIFVPFFKTITHLPPFIGMLFVLGCLWVYTEIFYNARMKHHRGKQNRLPQVIKRIDMPSILFFLGILMAVEVLDASGVLSATAGWLDENVHNVYVINVLLGIMSSIFDNVPLVAGVMGMYPVVDPATATGYAAYFVQDGIFWEFLSYCAGVGGSMLIIGSAAGVIAMGLEKISFGWYLRRISIPALVGYLAGAGVYILEVIMWK